MSHFFYALELSSPHSTFFQFVLRLNPVRLSSANKLHRSKGGDKIFVWPEQLLMILRTHCYVSSDCGVTYFSVTGDKPSFKSSGDRRKLSILSTISANVGLLILSDSQQLSIKL